ncbi:MAG: hypothetical protein A3B37_03365 [Candidatus Sungbacteria bacterium RIFCSPLOWO2_01_FULL_59_16]|uniref:Lipoprotein n=1 Tax=Candidatus Sungbacteria bacterium RIFCSPLOWO2_01_FULL_59_16 TaxID=1802280 RepID=A0A1G2LC86_9BACT|nr:MAG: hypothetical protein A3B37_03365 [Candidatus Sungbacteria bacterium RIFCSPLOWO2_01_FULL_59_16]
MAYWRTLGASLAAILVGGCAVAVAPTAVAHRCGNTPEETAAMFFDGINERSYPIIRRTVPPGVPLRAVFGNGNLERGREAIIELLVHPELYAGKEVDTEFRLLALNGAGARRTALIEREDRIIQLEPRRERTEIRRRTFAVEFDGGNCLTAVEAAEPHWRPAP